MAAHQSDKPELHVYTSEDVDRMARQQRQEDAASPPPAPPVPPTTPSRKAVRITRVALLIANPLLTILGILALASGINADPLARFIGLVALIMVAPTILGAMILACCLQFYLLGLFERKGMLARWNIPLSVFLGPIIALVLLRLLVSLMSMILGGA